MRARATEYTQWSGKSREAVAELVWGGQEGGCNLCKNLFGFVWSCIQSRNQTRTCSIFNSYSFHKYLLKYLLNSPLTSGSSWQRPREKNGWGGGGEPPLGAGAYRTTSPKATGLSKARLIKDTTGGLENLAHSYIRLPGYLSHILLPSET